MPTLAPILVYGRDSRLLQTRSWVLERAGFEVLATTEFDQVQHLATSRPLGLFILCHTLPIEDCDLVLSTVATLQPSLKKLVLTANTPVCSVAEGEITLSAFNGPQALIETVNQILAHHVAPISAV